MTPAPAALRQADPSARFAHPDVRIAAPAAALAWLRALPDGAVDHVICDPPYVDDVHNHASSVWFPKGKAPRRMHRDIRFAGLRADDYAIVPELLRVARRWVLAFCALEQFGDYKRAARAVHPSCYVRSMVVRRTQSPPQITGDRPRQAAEGIAVMHRPGRKRWNGGGGGGWYETPRAHAHKADAWHPTEKHVNLMRALVLDFTEPRDLVLDPYAGSGTTALACLIENRRAIVGDLDPAWGPVMHTRLCEEWDRDWAKRVRSPEGAAP